MLQPAEMPLILSNKWIHDDDDNAMAMPDYHSITTTATTNGHLIMNGKLLKPSPPPPRLPPLDLSLSTLANGHGQGQGTSSTTILPGPLVESPTRALNDRLRYSSDVDLPTRLPNNIHRRSSPARFSTSTHTPTSLLSPEPSISRFDAPKLNHRHTLEVPTPSTRTAPVAPRTSRDQQIPLSAASDDAYFGTARLSLSPSTHRGHRSSFSFGRRASRSMGSDLHLEESTQQPDDLESARMVEALRQKRAAKRRKKEEEEDDKVLVGTKVDKGHVNYETAYNMLTGIRHTVSRLNAKLDRVLEDADFDSCQTFAFDV